ncbi:uncharacterized protein LOC130614718 [Hydractinia symbiolongicarpus]|uniref:uncharacterized protein LOC130614718 n=1 Tax=Hydractinia symbiolongicarpus TaxID=13093 RepID=UPI00254FA941|nr:uncharacterized protein LOC130614718 [Hydractinia symbiolongicarpus]
MEKTDNWAIFLKEKLLFKSIIDGILLFTSNLITVQTYGCLENVPCGQLEQFKNIFDSLHDDNKHSELLVKGFTLNINSAPTKLVIRKCNLHSVYAVSKANMVGIIAVNLPFGVLLASHAYPITSAIAVQHVEDVCKLLRS